MTSFSRCFQTAPIAFVFCLATFAVDVSAQPAAPVSGATANGLGRLRQQAIGRGYSIADIVRISDNNLTVNAPQNLARPRTAQGNVLRPVSAAPPASPVRQAGAARIGGGTATSRGPATKPFSNITRRPTVSPYLLLFNDNNPFGNDDLNYQTLVRPRLQQQQFNQQVSRQAQAINQQLNAMAAQSAFQQQGNAELGPTGHAAVFGNTLRYFPGR